MLALKIHLSCEVRCHVKSPFLGCEITARSARQRDDGIPTAGITGVTGASIKCWVPPNEWFLVDTPIKMEDTLEVSISSKHTKQRKPAMMMSKSCPHQASRFILWAMMISSG